VGDKPLGSTARRGDGSETWTLDRHGSGSSAITGRSCVPTVKRFLPEDRVFPLSKDSHRRARSVRSLSAGDQETGALHLRALRIHDYPGGGPSSGPELENGQGCRSEVFGERQGCRSEVFGERLRDNRLSGASHPGHRRDLHPQRPPLPDPNKENS